MEGVKAEPSPAQFLSCTEITYSGLTAQYKLLTVCIRSWQKSDRKAERAAPQVQYEVNSSTFNKEINSQDIKVKQAYKNKSSSMRFRNRYAFKIIGYLVCLL